MFVFYFEIINFFLVKISFKKVKTDDEKPVSKEADDKEHIVEFKSVESEQTEEIPDVPLFTGFK
jgi:hypothetical protein